jgi:hypothetical protein
MPNITLSLPADVHEEMKNYPEIRWSEVARKAIIRKLTDLKRLDELLNRSGLAEADVAELDHLVKRGLAKRYKRKKRKGRKG